MKLSLYGFMTVNSLVDNTRHVDSLLGELSALARTYALDKGYYTNENYPDVRLVSFRCREDDANEVTVPTNLQDICIRLGAWLDKQAQTGGITPNNATNRQAIQAEFDDDIRVGKLGKIVSSKGSFLPQFIEFTINNPGPQYTDGASVKLWFSDSAFRNQYPYYDIKVIPPIENLDDFFTRYNEVQVLKETIRLPALHDKVNRIKDKSPYTLVKTYDYDWNGETDDERVSIPWTVLIYGGIGENLDIIKDALVNYILEHSEHDRDEWEKIFPDLFVPTEYVIVPNWTLPSVPGFRSIASMYSSTVPYSMMLPMCKEAMVGYEEAHIAKYLEVTGCLYKSIGLMICGHPQNRLAPISFYTKYPNYALIGTRTEDFNRMDVSHQQLVMMLNKLLIAAENAQPDTELDLDLVKVMREDVFYIATTYENVQFLVVARWNYINKSAKPLTRQGVPDDIAPKLPELIPA